MGFWDALDKALEKVADGADRAITHAAEDAESIRMGGSGKSVDGLKGKEPKAGETFSWGGGGSAKKDEKKDDGGFSWW